MNIRSAFLAFIILAINIVECYSQRLLKQETVLEYLKNEFNEFKKTKDSLSLNQSILTLSNQAGIAKKFNIQATGIYYHLGKSFYKRGNLKTNNTDFDSSVFYLRKLEKYDLQRILKSDYHKFNFYLMLSESHSELDNYDSAIYYKTKCLEFITEWAGNSNWIEKQILYDIAKKHEQLTNFSSALFHYEQIYQLPNLAAESDTIQTKSILHIARILSNENRHLKSLSYLNKIDKDIGSDEFRMMLNYLYGVNYNGIKEFTKANVHLREYLILADKNNLAKVSKMYNDALKIIVESYRKLNNQDSLDKYLALVERNFSSKNHELIVSKLLLKANAYFKSNTAAMQLVYELADSAYNLSKKNNLHYSSSQSASLIAAYYIHKRRMLVYDESSDGVLHFKKWKDNPKIIKQRAEYLEQAEFFAGESTIELNIFLKNSLFTFERKNELQGVFYYQLASWWPSYDLGKKEYENYLFKALSHFGDESHVLYNKCYLPKIENISFQETDKVVNLLNLILRERRAEYEFASSKALFKFIHEAVLVIDSLDQKKYQLIAFNKLYNEENQGIKSKGNSYIVTPTQYLPIIYEEYLRTKDQKLLNTLYRLFEKSKYRRLRKSILMRNSDKEIIKTLSENMRINDSPEDKVRLTMSYLFEMIEKSNNYGTPSVQLNLDSSTFNFKTDSSNILNSFFEAVEVKKGQKVKSYQDSINIILKNNYPEYYHLIYGEPNIPLEEVKGMIAKDQAIIEYSFPNLSQNLFTIILTADTTVVRKIESRYYSQIFKSIKELKREMKAGTNENNFISAYYLNNLLIEPIKDLIETKKELIFIPEVDLSSLPFEVFLNQKPSSLKSEKDWFKLVSDSAFLGQRYNVSYANSISQLYYKHSRRESDRVHDYTIFSPFDNSEACGVFSKKLSIAPNASRYLTTLSNNGLLLNGCAATKVNLLSSHVSCKVFLASTHSSSQNGGYLLCNTQLGILDTIFNKDIYNMVLDSDLAILASCESGDGELFRGEGMLGLTHSFQYAGSNSLISTSWQVNDSVTAIILKFFFDGLKKGVSKNLALSSAKRKYLNTTKNSELLHPYYWAGLMLYGNTDKIVFKGNASNDNSSKYFILSGSILSILLIYLSILYWNRGSSRRDSINVTS